MKDQFLSSPLLTFFAALFALLAVAGISCVLVWNPSARTRNRNLLIWLRRPERHSSWERKALTTCPQGVFPFPTDGYLGYLWGDSFRPGHTHQGIDIFSGKSPGETPVFAVSDGFLTRLPEWKSSLIIRIPSDPLRPDRQIWAYYTHLAGPDGESFIAEEFPPGSREILITEGTLLGFQGNYSGKPGSPVGVHLHFSLVKDDGQGSFLNELNIHNTLDPSPYFGMPLTSSYDGVPSIPCFQKDQPS